MLGVRLDDERRLAAVAGNEGRSESGIARDAVRRYVEQYDQAFLAEARRQSLRAAVRGKSDEDRFWEALAAVDDGRSDTCAHRAF